MKKHLLILLLVSFFLKTYAQSVHQYSQALDIPAMEQKANAGYFRSINSGAANTYDLNYHRCIWTLDPAVNYIKGAITSHFKPTVSGFTSMQFDLDASFTIDSVKYHASLLSFSQTAPALLQITFPATLPINVLDSVTVFYQGAPPNTGFGSFIQTTHGPSSTPVIWTLSEPFGARDWWPCKQDLNDKVDSVETITTVPNGNRVASNGVLLSEVTSGSNTTFHWKTKHPIAAYLIAVATTNYAVYSDYVPLSPTDSIEVLNYVYPEDLLSAQAQTPDIINVIKLYDSLTITYPFADEKYGHAQFGWGGGMEHQTMSFVVGFNHGLIAHECAHQWFGDHVTCGSWQDIWLNEGFATYFEGLTEERYFPSTWYSWKQGKMGSVTSQPGGSVLCDDTTSVGRIFDGRLSYNKGAYLLHMLRWKMGDSLFFAALKDYLTTPGLSGAYAKTPDFKARMEAISGLNLTNFFNEWYYNQGYPSYQLLWGQSGSAVNVTINQTQSHSSVSFFDMPVPVKFIGATQDTTIVFDHTFSGQTFSTTVGFPIINAQFDPELWILSANNTVIGIPDHIIIEQHVEVFPNPALRNITVQMKLNDKTDVTFELYDVNGKKVLSENQTMASGTSSKTMDISTLSRGTYFLKLKGNKIEYSQKIVKQ